MEETLIAAVSDYPELYNSTLEAYKDSNKKANAWRAVSLQVQLPEESCRRKWKSLRDGFIRDKRSAERRRATGDWHRGWKYCTQMAFLTPYIQSKSFNATVEELEDEMEARPTDCSDAYAITAIHTEFGDAGGELGLPASVVPVSKRRKWQVAGNEDELFLLSLLPHLKKLSFEKKCQIKLKFHQLLYEAEFH